VDVSLNVSTLDLQAMVEALERVRRPFAPGDPDHEEITEQARAAGRWLHDVQTPLLADLVSGGVEATVAGRPDGPAADRPVDRWHV
jgi:hypothetical protein